MDALETNHTAGMMEFAQVKNIEMSERNVKCYLNYTQGLFASQNSIYLECHTHADCPGDSDTCISNACFCGSTDKCSGRSDTCVIGKCKCGGNKECSKTAMCIVGECRGM